MRIFTIPLHSIFFFFNATATTEIYTLSLHDALPICREALGLGVHGAQAAGASCLRYWDRSRTDWNSVFRIKDRFCRRSEEHTSELQSRRDLVCRLLLEKKKKKTHKS